MLELDDIWSGNSRAPDEFFDIRDVIIELSLD